MIRARFATIERMHYETALSFADEADLVSALPRSPCACGEQLGEPDEREALRYDGRTMTVVSRRCGACGAVQTLYCDIAAARVLAWPRQRA